MDIRDTASRMEDRWFNRRLSG